MRSFPIAAFLGLSSCFLGLSGCGDDGGVPAPSDGGRDGAADAADASPQTSSDSGPQPSVSSDAAPSACGFSFVDLRDGALLSKRDDADNTCSNGVQIDVVITTEAPNGTEAELTVGAAAPLTATVSAGELRFAGVTIPGSGDTTLTVNSTNSDDCQAQITVQGACNAAPTCVISLPVVDADRPLLNGVAAPEGDRTSPAGQPYATHFRVETDLPNGSLVLLSVDDGDIQVAGTARNGSADFPELELGSDGVHTVVATCGTDVATQSETFTAEVDTSAPELLSESLTPTSGQHYSPEQDLDAARDELQFDVCVPVASSDALDLTGPNADNVCVAIGTQAPVCSPAKSDDATLDADGACVRLDCPGSAGFDLNVTVRDAAGNPTTTTITGVTCASSEPLVEIVSLQDSTNDPENVSKHLLAATAPSDQLRDEDPDTSGAQHTLVACTNASGGSARLLAGPAGGTLAERATAVLSAAQPADDCPADLPRVARFAAATLPESTQSPALVLTEVVVEVTDESTETNESSPVRLWVDSVAPTLTLFSPNDLCGLGVDSDTDSFVDLSFLSSAYPSPVTVSVENGGTVGAPVTLTSSTPTPVLFPLGTNLVSASVADAAGNITLFGEEDCQVFVGDPPAITWVSPASAVTLLNAQGTSSSADSAQDADANTTGWQGLLSVTIGNLQPGDDATGEVQFQLNNVDIGQPLPLSAGTGDATTRTVTLDTADFVGGLPDTDAGTLRVLVRGTSTEGRSARANLRIDTVVPTAPIDVVPEIGPNPGDRRRTRFQLTWEASADGALQDQPVEGYRIAISESGPITDQTEFDAAYGLLGTELATAPVDPGQLETALVDGLKIEHVYYFAVQAYDAAGNQSPLTSGTATGADAPGIAARFRSTVLNHPGSIEERFGYALDGSTDLTGDGRAELIVSAFNPITDGHNPANPAAVVYIFKGTANGYSQTPLVTITGDPNASFGYSVAVVGDINADTPANPTATQAARAQDLVITAQYDARGGGAGAAYVFFGRNWDNAANQQLQASDADAVIVTGGATDFVFSEVDNVVRLGDFDGDGVEDFALGHYSYSRDGLTTFPGAVSVILGQSGFTDLNLTGDASFGTRALLYRGAGDTLLGGTGLSALSDGTLVANSYAGALQDSVAIFAPPTGTPAAITEYTAADLYTVADPGDGTWVLQLGLLAGNAIAIGNPNPDTYPRQGGFPGRGIVDVFLQNNAATPFSGTPLSLYDRNVTTGFGRVTVGNAYPGRSAGYALPFLGTSSSAPNLVLGGVNAAAGGPPDLHLLSGATLASLSGSVDLGDPASPVSDVVVSLKSLTGAPQSWANGAQGVAIHDVDGDGYADLAIGESAVSEDEYDGHVIILY